jgi:hypothetical protein
MGQTFLTLLTAFFLLSCQGYRIKNEDNPFVSYGIKSVSVPMFINRSSLANVSGPLTKEIVMLLASYPGLTIYSGEDSRADAVLVGIVSSPARRSDTLKTSATNFTSDDLKTSLGSRPEFYAPTTTAYTLSLQIALIKDPAREDRELIESSIGKFINNHPKIIFNQILDVSNSFDRTVKETLTTESEGVTNFTKTKAQFEASVQNLAKRAALDFKELVLNVF